MPEKFSLKDFLFNKTKVEKIATEITAVYPKFAQSAFVKEVVEKFPELELKARISWIAECLKKYLPAEYREAVEIILRALPAPSSPHLSDDDFGDFIYAPYADFVAKNGCTAANLSFSLNALYHITQRFSAEDAIRYFLNAYPQETLAQLLVWSRDSHYHVRRLCSEGTRPKLPWAQKIHMASTAPLPILDVLFCDTTRFVTRSVANHLNDISKINPDLAIDTLVAWQKSGRQQSKEMAYITQHALRTLVKQGNVRALSLLGFDSASLVQITDFSVPKEVSMNTALEFSFSLQSEKDIDVLIDYVLYFQNKAGKLKSKKVFKLKQMTLKKNTPVHVAKRHMLRQFMTTRTLYAGQHEIELQINGKAVAKCLFILRDHTL